MSNDTLLGAATEAKAARERLTTTVQEIQARLEPATLVGDAVDGVKSGALDMVETVGDVARRKPLLAGSVVVAVVALILRRPVARIRARKRRRREETGRRWRRLSNLANEPRKDFR